VSSSPLIKVQNTHYPDNDDTLVSLLCIVMYRPDELPSETCLAAIEFLLGMQCSNGGWACFDARDNRNRWLNHTPFGQGNEFFDPSVPDITGRVLECFGLLLATNHNFHIKTSKKLMTDDLCARIRRACYKAVVYLQREQDSRGVWGSRWHVNYLNGTYSVLCGLKFFLDDVHDESSRERLVGRPLAWLKSVQNHDGGWGEHVVTYQRGSDAVEGDSTPTQTAWALMALLAHVPPMDPTVIKGVQYLISTQTTGLFVSDKDGTGIGIGPGATWRQFEYVSVGFPDILWLDYSSSRHGYPMMALGRWLHEIQQSR
jgi:squalene-hopene/tetraprenyl-beta-curcumene cyclase